MQDHDPGKRARSIEAGLTASRLSLVWTIASGLAAITIGVVGGSLVLAAFGSIGLLDGVGSAALVVHFRHAARLERISESSERITLLVVAFGMAVVGLVTTGESIHRLVERVRVGSLPEGIALAAVSAVILSILAVSKRRIGRRIPSRALLADSWLSATGAALALISVAGTGLTATFGYWWADAAAAALVAAGAVAVAIGLAREELNLDREAGLKTGPNRRAPETTRGVNRSQALVLAFFAVVVIALFTMRVVAPAVYSDALALPLGGSPVALNFFVAGVVGFVALISVGVVLRWRWMFWLIVVAFVAGILRLPASILEVSGVLPSMAPVWYLVLQAVIGLAQFAIGLALIKGYRRAGPWGAF